MKELLSGIIIVDKPSGWTSHDVVAKLRGVLKIKRVGHGGTLDPMATGVLPIFVGRATRAVEFCENTDKEYIAGIKFGITTDTQDTSGKVLDTRDVNVTTAKLQNVIPQFLFAQKQIPPMYSAIKIDGKKLYQLARKGVEIERPPRDIYISELELLNNGDLRIVCSKGTYIRTLCHDIGQALGCGAAMSSLRRTSVGSFTLENSYTVDDILKIAERNEIDVIIKSIDVLFESYPKLTLSDEDTNKCKNGVVCQIDGLPSGKYRVYSPSGEFLAFSEAKNNKLKTIKSFFTT